MPIQPIDLQTLFAHINQVGKDQAALKEGILAQQAAQANELIKEKKHQDESVNKAEKANEDKQKIYDDHKKGSPGEASVEPEKDNGKPDEEQKKISVFTDPDLGKNIDISG
jgi:hypothetical protein